MFSALILWHTSHSKYSMAAVSSASLCTTTCKPTVSKLIHLAGNIIGDLFAQEVICISLVDTDLATGWGGCMDLIQSCKTNALIKSMMLTGYVIRPITIHCSAFSSSGYSLPRQGHKSSTRASKAA